MLQKKEIDMIHGPLGSKILLFTIPLMCSSMLQLLFNAADVVVVGRFAGDTSLAAVGSTTSLVNLIIQLFNGLSVGANVVAAKTIGEGHGERIGRVVRTSITASLISGCILLVFGVSMARLMLLWMGTPEDVLGLASLYLKIYFCGMPFQMVYNFGSALLRAKGDTERPLYYLTLAGVINAVLNCIFVIVFHMDVAGVGLATVISQIISAVLIIRCLCAETDVLHLDLRNLGIDKEVLPLILRVGLPAGIQGVVFSFSNVIIQSAVNSFGSVNMAGSAAALSVGSFVYAAMNAFHQAALSFNGQNMGARQYKRVDRITFLCVLYVFVIGSLLSVGAYLLGPQLLSIYSASPQVIEMGMIRMRFCVLLYGLCGLMDVMPGCIRGMGYSILPMIVSLFGSCVFRLVWLATFFQYHHTIENLYLSYPVSWIVTFLVHVVCYFVIRKKTISTH